MSGNLDFLLATYFKTAIILCCDCVCASNVNIMIYHVIRLYTYCIQSNLFNSCSFMKGWQKRKNDLWLANLNREIKWLSF